MKKGFYLIIILLMIFSLTGVALAGKPDNLPRDPLTALWDAVNALQTNDTAKDAEIADLQAQITDLKATVPKVAIVKGSAEDFDEISPPTGFTTSDCEVIVHPPGGLNLMYGSGDTLYFAHDIEFYADDQFGMPNTWTIHSLVNYHSEDYTEWPTSNPVVSYTVICIS